MTQRILTALGVAVLLSSQLGAGVVYEIEVKDHEQSPPRTSETEVAAEGRNLKMGIAAGESRDGSGEMIFRGDRKEVVVVDHADKSYTVIDEAAIQQIAGQVSQVANQMAEALKNVPEDKRAMMEKMMKERMPAQPLTLPQTEVRKTGDRGERNGYPCVKYEVLLDGRKIRELWVTDWGNVEGGDEVADTFREMAEFFSEMLDAISGAAGGLGGFGPPDGGIFADLEEIDGFPVVTSGFGEDGSLEDESGLRSAQRRTLDPAAFEPPSGYKRRSMMGQ